MKQTRKKYSPEFKARVALEALKEKETLAELSRRFEVNAMVISRWKNEMLANMSNAFKEVKAKEKEVDVDKLYSQIGQLKVENDFLKKSLKKLGL